MLYPTISELTKDEYNRYELALATAKCARLITNEYVKQREAAEKAATGNKEADRNLINMINKEYRDEKAVKNAITRINSGEYKIVRVENTADEVEETVEETVAADAEYLKAYEAKKTELKAKHEKEIQGEISADYIAHEKEILKALQAGERIKFLYMIPDFQNPSGESLSLEERQMLVELARKYDFLIVEDSPYRELRYEGDHIPTMYSLDPDRVIHLGSFSKIFAPGFRLGWAIAHPEILDKIYVCKQSLDLCPPIFDQYVAAEFLASGRLDENLAKSVALYKGKRDLMLSLLEKHMPEGVRWTHPEGGLFLFLTMPEGFDAVKFYDKALAAGVAYVAGEFFHPDRSGKNTMRLNFSFMSEEKMREGVMLMAGLLTEIC